VSLHHVLPNTKVFIDLVLLEKVNLLQLLVHILLGHPFLLRYEVGLLLHKLSHSLATYSHVLVKVPLVEVHDAVIVRI
jgi:hypothetical protein